MADSAVDISGNDIIMPAGGLVDGIDVGTAVPSAASAASSAQSAISAHSANTSNPHNTTAAQVGAPPTTRTITAGTGLSGGGDLSANRTLAVVFGTTAGTVCAGDDSRLSGGGGGAVYSSGQVTFAANTPGVLLAIPTVAAASPGRRVTIVLRVLAIDTTSGDEMEQEVRLSYKRVTGGHPVLHATGSPLQFPYNVAIKDDPSWGIVLSVNTGTDTIDVTFTPDATNQTKAQAQATTAMDVTFT